jgi:hypothetical protein
MGTITEGCLTACAFESAKAQGAMTRKLGKSHICHTGLTNSPRLVIRSDACRARTIAESMATSARSAATGYRTYGMPPPFLTKMASNLYHRLLLLIAVNVEIFTAWIECRPFLLESFQTCRVLVRRPPANTRVCHGRQRRRIGGDNCQGVTTLLTTFAADTRTKSLNAYWKVRWRNCSDPDFETFLEETEKGKGRQPD